MQVQSEPRVKKRIPCELSFGGGRHSGIVLNVSRGGLYVQTSVGPSPGDLVEIDLSPSAARNDAMNLRATVVWKQVVSRRLLSGGHGGVGLRIKEADAAYYDFLGELLPGGASAQPLGATPTRPAPAEPTPDTAPRYRVRVRELGRPRSKTLLVGGDSEQEASERALFAAGEGWTVLEVVERSS